MAFGKITKEDLVAAGLDPDLLKTLQEKGVTKDDLTTLKTELATSLTTTVTDLIKNSFTELETKLRTPTRKEGDGNGDGNNNNERPDEQMEYLTDPVAFVKKENNKVVVAAAVEFKRMSRDMAWRELSQSLKGFKNKALKEEIEEEWKKYTPQVMAQNNTDPVKCLQQIHDMVLGAHHDEITQDTNKKDGKYNLVHSGTGSSGGATSSSNNSSTSTTELSEAEKSMAKKFGMTEEEWVKQGEDMEKEEVDRKAGILTGAGR